MIVTRFHIGDVNVNHQALDISSKFLYCKITIFPFVINLWGDYLKLCEYSVSYSTLMALD